MELAQIKSAIRNHLTELAQSVRSSEQEESSRELDLPPEYCHYQDTGCELARSCLNCPFEKCIYDEPRGRQRYTKRLRNQQILRLFTTEGKGIRELATIFGVSQRTIQRALKRSQDE